MMEPGWSTYVAFFFTIAAYTFLLVRMLSWAKIELSSPVPGQGSMTVVQGAAMEKKSMAAPTSSSASPDVWGGSDTMPINSDTGTQATAPAVQTSFSRVAGLIGAIALAALFASGGYWVFFKLFFGQLNDSAIKDFAMYLASGAALFAPYAVNQIASIFRG